MLYSPNMELTNYVWIYGYQTHLISKLYSTNSIILTFVEYLYQVNATQISTKFSLLSKISEPYLLNLINLNRFE